MTPKLISQLTWRLKESLPAEKAHNIMQAYPLYPYSKNYVQRVPASVLILLFPKNNIWYFFLTKRTEKVEHHKGQISLPGGVLENNETLTEAALRETHEEIGVSPEFINVIGPLTSFHIPVSGFEIFPFVGWTKEEPQTTIQEKEVERIFSVSLNSFLDNNNQKKKKEIFNSKMINIPFFDLENEHVWGATSIILSEFKVILQEIL